MKKECSVVVSAVCCFMGCELRPTIFRPISIYECWIKMDNSFKT